MNAPEEDLLPGRQLFFEAAEAPYRREDRHRLNARGDA
jgi:hypothetical protein